jgi:hypothetical protein
MQRAGPDTLGLRAWGKFRNKGDTVCMCVRMFLVAFVTLRYPDDRLCVRFMKSSVEM